MRPSPNNPWGVFVTGTGEFINVTSHDSNAQGYDITAGGFTLGADYRLRPDLAIGINGSYAHSWADLTNQGQVTADGGKVGLYAMWFPADLYIGAAFSAGWTNYDTRRAALLGEANGSTDGYDLNVFVTAGYDWKMGSLNFGPVASFQYTYINLDSFTETGSLAPLHLPSQDEDSIRSTLGGRMAYDFRYRGIIVRPEARAAWLHEYDDTAYPIDSVFASGAGGVFTVRGPDIGRDAALAGGSILIQWNTALATYVSYDGVFGRSNFDSHNISGGVHITF
jgi:outer membrane autotransporter protein